MERQTRDGWIAGGRGGHIDGCRDSYETRCKW